MEKILVGNFEVEGDVLVGCHNLPVDSDVVVPSSYETFKDKFLNTILCMFGVKFSHKINKIGDGAFSYEYIRSVVISDGIKEIGDDAFHSCSHLESVVIPDSVETIGYCAFRDCCSLVDVKMGNGVTSICSNAFLYCIRLERIEIPSSVSYFGKGCFAYCDKLTINNQNNDDFSLCEYMYENNGYFSRGLIRCSGVSAYKAFSIETGDLKCRDFIYEVGEKYHSDRLCCCKIGFHACSSPFSVLNYYNERYGIDFVVGKVTMSGYIHGNDKSNDTKFASTDIRIDKILTKEEFIGELNNFANNIVGF